MIHSYNYVSHYVLYSLSPSSEIDESKNVSDKKNFTVICFNKCVYERHLNQIISDNITEIPIAKIES